MLFKGVNEPIKKFAYPTPGFRVLCEGDISPSLAQVSFAKSRRNTLHEIMNCTFVCRLFHSPNLHRFGLCCDNASRLGLRRNRLAWYVWRLWRHGSFSQCISTPQTSCRWQGSKLVSWHHTKLMCTTSNVCSFLLTPWSPFHWRFSHRNSD